MFWRKLWNWMVFKLWCLLLIHQKVIINISWNTVCFKIFWGKKFSYPQMVSLKDNPMRVSYLFLYLSSIIFQTLIPCYYGNEISAVSYQLSASLFHSEWMYKNKNFKTSMLVLLEKVKKQIKITALGFYDVNLTTFTTICFILFCVHWNKHKKN